MSLGGDEIVKGLEATLRSLDLVGRTTILVCPRLMDFLRCRDLSAKKPGEIPGKAK